MNPITLYLVFNLVPLEDFAKRILGGPVQQALGTAGELAIALAVVGMVFALAQFLYRRQIFLRL